MHTHIQQNVYSFVADQLSRLQFSGVAVCSLNGPVRTIFISVINKSHEQREMESSKGDIRKVETPPTHFHLPTPVANIL
jgi:hypothetical protein